MLRFFISVLIAKRNLVFDLDLIYFLGVIISLVIRGTACFYQSGLVRYTKSIEL